jgi:hypothetical protein
MHAGAYTGIYDTNPRDIYIQELQMGKEVAQMHR